MTDAAGPAGADDLPGDTSDERVLQVRRVSKRFTAGKRQVHALRDVTLDARAGLITGLLGPDGAGKTTLMRLSAGLLEPDAGEIRVLGLDAAKQSLAVQATIGYMPQRFGLYEDLTVQENLDLYADLQDVAEDQRPQRYRELMHMTGLAPFTGRLAGRLSGGMKQKLGLACTLVRPPRLLLLDEPTVGVDPVSRRELWQIIDRLVRKERMSVLLSTAYLDEAERCDEVALLHEGQLFGHGAPGTFTARMGGRVFLVSSASLRKRPLQERLTARNGIVDAVIQGERVRIVTADAAQPAIDDPADAEVAATEPRFEDTFVALLKGERPSAGAVPPNHRAATGAVPARAQPGPVIRVQHLQRRFGDFYAVKDVSFEVDAGEVFGLLGANGAGKSTTFRMLCGLLPASGGELSVAGLDLRHARATARARIGYMSQKFSLYGNLTVGENLQFFASAYGLTGSRCSERVRWAQAQFALEPVTDTTSADLPLGYKQRLALACALMHEPDILFLDEPTSGVDPLARREFWRRINALAEDGVTVLVTTHFMEEAEYCDRLAIMDAGEILALGTPEAIKAGCHDGQHPQPSLEDAFIQLLQQNQPARAAS
ncbi:MAG: ATP-binding cassette domain-containing protein [Gammaproteobacteria bacterium]